MDPFDLDFELALADLAAIPGFELTQRRASANTSSYPSKSTKPLKLPVKAPACFTKAQWLLYRPLAQYTFTNGANFCRDCTEQHRDKMRVEGRCKFPGTTFRVVAGVVVGERKK